MAIVFFIYKIRLYSIFGADTAVYLSFVSKRVTLVRIHLIKAMAYKSPFLYKYNPTNNLHMLSQK